MARKRWAPEEASIEAVTHDGRGIATVSGKKVFVAGALPGETVTFMRRKSKRSFDEAELLAIQTASPERIDARCEAFGRCGGCSLQHVSDEHQREVKASTLTENLSRIGNVEPQQWLPTLYGQSWNYRRRARLAVKDVAAKGRTLVGFREKLAPYVTDMHRCEVLAQPLDGLIDALSDCIGQLSIRARLPQIEVAVADNAIALVFRVLDLPSEADKKQLSQFGAEHAVRIYLQPGGLESLQLLFPESVDDMLHYTLPDFDVRIDFSPVDFVQINSEINQGMVQRAIDLLEVKTQHRVLDLFCGIGNFSLPLARRAGSVLGVEGEKTLVTRAAENAAKNDLGNVDFRVADLNKIDGGEGWVKAGCDRLLLDPARSGAPEVVSRMHLFAPERVVYVSCHPGTLARDAGVLVHDQGYTLESAGIIDMFPHTAHVESIAVFRKK